MRTQDFDYHLPPDLIAQEPLPRGGSRLMVVERRTGGLCIRQFRDLPHYLGPGDTVVVNDTRVSARRLHGNLADGAEAEALLVAPVEERCWSALVRPGRRLRTGALVRFVLADGTEVAATVLGTTEEGGRILEFADRATRDRLASEGEVPLPPYIRKRLRDEERYQTVFAQEEGSAAAPTAGLHFTQEMFDRIAERGARVARITLHVGVDTFRPVREADIERHRMHGECYRVPCEAAEAVAGARRVVAVGTTCVRALESAATEDGRLEAGEGTTTLFITPGYRFRLVGAMLTNFHLPRSTLLMLVSAFAGRELILEAYAMAVRERMRFYSFGDAMLIL